MSFAGPLSVRAFEGGEVDVDYYVEEQAVPQNAPAQSSAPVVDVDVGGATHKKPRLDAGRSHPDSVSRDLEREVQKNNAPFVVCLQMGLSNETTVGQVTGSGRISKKRVMWTYSYRDGRGGNQIGTQPVHFGDLMRAEGLRR